MINDGYKNCVEINSSEIQKGNNGRLVFLSGLAQTESSLKDNEVGLELEKALKLVRKVEMYQWQEKKQETSRRDTFGGGETTRTIYNYSKIWSETQISDSDFQDQSHVNPSFERWILHSEKFLSKDTHIGNFRLNDGELEQLKNLKHYELRQDFESILTDELKRRIKDCKITVTNNYLYLRVPTSNFEESIGDIRVSYQFSDEQYLSIVACQSDDMLVPYDLRTKGIKQIDLERTEKHQIKSLHDKLIIKNQCLDEEILKIQYQKEKKIQEVDHLEKVKKSKNNIKNKILRKMEI